MKEDKIEVGEYVRTKDGRIYQVNSSNDEWALSDIFYKVIVKHSKNIIDLIEVGDYVNGYYVIDDAKKDKKYITIAVNYREYGEEYLKNKEIESVITKEQFKSIEYRLED